ncbi:hypothetical protein HU200_006418 [Digitaria exilis]|uniref:Uncharacterized protein n=1 Tax=Digitaria exilis TaxID=1010633 RepID=A0A835FR31_9POAL|nr:hypothetical protein HU200_006418 [Digitaria exilis]
MTISWTLYPTPLVTFRSTFKFLDWEKTKYLEQYP